MDSTDFGKLPAVSEEDYANAIRVSRKVIFESVGLKQKETVLIITNPDYDVDTISRSLYHACIECEGKPTIIYQPSKTQSDFREFAVQQAFFSNPDVWISISKNKLGKDELGLKGHVYRGPRGGVGSEYQHVLVSEGTSRAFWSPGITLDSWIRTADIDYTKLEKDADKIHKLLTNASSIRITSKAGTDLTINLEGRVAFKDDGNYRSKGVKGGNIPAGEAFISPVNETAEGIVVFDGVISAYDRAIIVKNPVQMGIKGGYVQLESVSGAGEEASKVRESLEMGMAKSRELGKPEGFIKNSLHIGELGIGLNEKARLVDSMLEAEKVRGTIHLAFGSNYDNDAEASTHYDNVMRNPTAVLKILGKEVMLMEEGELVGLLD
ncbi:MAG: aminopeptidase [Nanoarchaeota archaeon]